MKHLRRASLLFALSPDRSPCRRPGLRQRDHRPRRDQRDAAIDRHGHAHVSYRSGGRTEVLVACGAINARAPSRSVPQVKFQIRYGQRGNGVCLSI